jgi:aryl-alcohol dehydrogenase-like predicted oxidoreductase
MAMPGCAPNGTSRLPGTRLILGGHSFISQLGSDPPASESEQRRIVEACLDHGVRWFDTTYQPERVALGNILHALGRRDEAAILAWNFFRDFSPGDDCGPPECYRPGHIDVILEQLRTPYVDCLVAVPTGDAEENRRQADLMVEWQRKGYARSLGLWVEDQPPAGGPTARGPFLVAIRPLNVTTRDAARAFAPYKRAGWETIATSPFVRGWELDRIVARASARGNGDTEKLRAVIADLMLRFSLFQRDVDRVTVAMRRVEWVARNLESVARGPLTAKERRLLERMAGMVPRWRRSLRGVRARTRRLWWRLRGGR